MPAVLQIHGGGYVIGSTRRVPRRGESAGGGLAAALALLACDRGGPEIIHQNLFCPMRNDRTCIAQAPTTA